MIHISSTHCDHEPETVATTIIPHHHTSVNATSMKFSSTFPWIILPNVISTNNSKTMYIQNGLDFTYYHFFSFLFSTSICRNLTFLPHDLSLGERNCVHVLGVWPYVLVRAFGKGTIPGEIIKETWEPEMRIGMGVCIKKTSKVVLKSNFMRAKNLRMYFNSSKTCIVIGKCAICEFSMWYDDFFLVYPNGWVFFNSFISF